VRMHTLLYVCHIFGGLWYTVRLVTVALIPGHGVGGEGAIAFPQ